MVAHYAAGTCQVVVLNVQVHHVCRRMPYHDGEELRAERRGGDHEVQLAQLFDKPPLSHFGVGEIREKANGNQRARQYGRRYLRDGLRSGTGEA